MITTIEINSLIFLSFIPLISQSYAVVDYNYDIYSKNISSSNMYSIGAIDGCTSVKLQTNLHASGISDFNYNWGFVNGLHMCSHGINKNYYNTRLGFMKH